MPNLKSFNMQPRGLLRLNETMPNSPDPQFIEESGLMPDLAWMMQAGLLGNSRRPTVRGMANVSQELCDVRKRL